MSSARRKGKQPAITPRIKVWLEVEGKYVFGFGICQILQAIDRTGSIKEAAAELHKSYRYVWNRIKEAEQAIGLELVESHVGGANVSRSFLTAQARQLLEAFLKLRTQMLDGLNTSFAQFSEQKLRP